MTIQQIILEQLGGQKFIAMTGSKDFIGDKDTLRMSLAKNASKANRLWITYNPDDTYTMEFFRYTAPRFNSKTLEFSEAKTEKVKTYSHIYCDQLQELFTEVTHMYTRLF